MQAGLLKGSGYSFAFSAAGSGKNLNATQAKRDDMLSAQFLLRSLFDSAVRAIDAKPYGPIDVLFGFFDHVNWFMSKARRAE
jgi:hypothetical protein